MDAILLDACGHYVETAAKNEIFKAFVPAPLPAIIDYQAIAKHLAEAERAVGRLEAAVESTHNCRHVKDMLLVRDCVYSSRIERIECSLEDYYLAELGSEIGCSEEALESVKNCVEALKYGLVELHHFPFSKRLLRNLHEIQMAGPDGKGKTPGEFRRSQNWIGGSKPSEAEFVPPPVPDMHRCLDALENFANLQDDIPDLVRAGMVHAQFETIHPLLDGNGRVGRHAIHLLLADRGLATGIVLPISEYLYMHRDDYYAALAKTRFNAGWTDYMVFFLTGIKWAADLATAETGKYL